MTILVIKNGCHTHINAEKWSGENLTNLTACYGHRMVTYDETLLCFGGYGIPSSTTQPGAEFTKNSRFTDGGGWTNEVHAYDLRTGESMWHGWELLTVL